MQDPIFRADYRKGSVIVDPTTNGLLSVEVVDNSSVYSEPRKLWSFITKEQASELADILRQWLAKGEGR
jgi:hypothetical protein